MGELFGEEIKETIALFYKYYMDQLETILEKKIPAFIARKIDAGG